MGLRSLGRLAALTVAVVFVAGCGSQSVNPVPKAAGWQILKAPGRALVYAASGKTVNVYSYPGGKQVGTLSGFTNALGACSDANGNVWIADAATRPYAGGTLIEYAHGGTAPIETLQDTGYFEPVACSVDPSTGNLAAANSKSGGVEYPITIWAGAQGSPTYVQRTEGLAANNPFTIAYYGNGDVYIRSGRYLKGEAWVAKGSYTMQQFAIRKNAYYGWDGQYFVINSGAHSKRYEWNMTLFKLNGATGTEVGHVMLHYTNCLPSGAFSIEGEKLAVVCENDGSRAIAYYRYPWGGNPIAIIAGVTANGVTISNK